MTVLFTQPSLKPTKAKTIEKAKMDVHQCVKDFRRTCKDEKNVFPVATGFCDKIQQLVKMVSEEIGCYQRVLNIYWVT